jgi:hypothetical protein
MKTHYKKQERFKQPSIRQVKPSPHLDQPYHREIIPSNLYSTTFMKDGLTVTIERKVLGINGFYPFNILSPCYLSGDYSLKIRRGFRAYLKYSKEFAHYLDSSPERIQAGWTQILSDLHEIGAPVTGECYINVPSLIRAIRWRETHNTRNDQWRAVVESVRNRVSPVKLGFGKEFGEVSPNIYKPIPCDSKTVPNLGGREELILWGRTFDEAVALSKSVTNGKLVHHQLISHIGLNSIDYQGGEHVRMVEATPRNYEYVTALGVRSIALDAFDEGLVVQGLNLIRRIVNTYVVERLEGKLPILILARGIKLHSGNQTRTKETEEFLSLFTDLLNYITITASLPPGCRDVLLYKARGGRSLSDLDLWPMIGEVLAFYATDRINKRLVSPQSLTYYTPKQYSWLSEPALNGKLLTLEKLQGYLHIAANKYFASIDKKKEEVKKPVTAPKRLSERDVSKEVSALPRKPPVILVPAKGDDPFAIPIPENFPPLKPLDLGASSSGVLDLIKEIKLSVARTNKLVALLEQKLKV